MDVYVLNKNFETTIVLDTYKSLIWTDRYNTYGDVELYLPMNMRVYNNIEKDFYLYYKESDHIMIVEELYIESDSEDGDYLVVTGKSLESILLRRVVWGQRTMVGSLQDQLLELLNDSIISPQNTKRKISNFVFVKSTDERIVSLTIDSQYTGETLYEVITSQCTANKLGFKISLNDDNQFVCSLYYGTNRTYEQDVVPYVVFSPNFDNVINSKYLTSNSNYKNVTLVGGEGEGTEQTMVEVGDCIGLYRREIFTNASNVSSDDDAGKLTDEEYVALLTSKGNELLAEHIVNTAFEAEVDSSRLFIYGRDFFMGDIVQMADSYGNEGVYYIPELIISQNEGGYYMYPTFEKYEESEA